MECNGGTGFLIGGFAQKKFEHQSKNTAMNNLNGFDPGKKFVIE